jgi:hypothetical protein
LEVEGPELVVADDDLGITLVGLGFPVGDVVELENPVPLHLEVGVVGLLPGLYGLKGDTLLAEKRPESLMADVVDHPLSHKVLGQLRERPGGKGLVVVGRPRAIFLMARRSATVNLGGRPPAYLGAKDSNPSALKLCRTSRTRSSDVKAILAI